MQQILKTIVVANTTDQKIKKRGNVPDIKGKIKYKRDINK